MGRHAGVLIALAMTSGAALAQQYPPGDARNPEWFRQQEERQRGERDEADRQRRNEAAVVDAENYRRFMDNQRRLQEKLSGDVERDRAMFLKMPPLPAERNRLLGKWVLDKTKKRPANAFAEINAAISGPACAIVYGDGVWDFRPQAIWSNDAGFGEKMMGPTDYRGNDAIVAVIPKSGLRLLVFEIAGPDQVKELTSTRIGADACVFRRVGADAVARSSDPRPASPGGRVSPPPQVAMANAAPPPASTRPSPEVCRQTLLDKLGSASLQQARQVLGVRFKDTIDGTVPNSQNLRLDARGSECDDPRINAALYDFDAAGVLASVTYVWARPAGPAPAPIFSERVKSLSAFHALPAPQSPGRLQSDTALGRLILQDIPERNLLLEAYVARK